MNAAWAAEWEDYKRAYLYDLDAQGLHSAHGRRKVGRLLTLLSSDHVRMYESFQWREETPATDYHAAVPAEDKYD